MVLSEAIIHFEPGKPLRKDIEVENPSSENLYVEITPAVVEEPGTKSETTYNNYRPSQIRFTGYTK